MRRRRPVLRTLARLFRLALGLGLYGLWVLGVVRIAAVAGTAGRIAQDAPQASSAPVAIVFGAAVRNGIATPILQDRVARAVELYRAGKVRKLLMSGDNRFIDYNEPEAMRQVALRLGVRDEDIVLDYAGRSTYDTCYRARAIFGLNQAVLVTQRFHLPRALLLCESFGIHVTGYAADLRVYAGGTANELREVAALPYAILQRYVAQTTPVLGTPEPIR